MSEGKDLVPTRPKIWVWQLVPEVGEDQQCQARVCRLRAVAIYLWLSEDWTRLEARGVCVGHAEALRNTGVGVVLPPHDFDFERIRQAVAEEVQRRQFERMWAQQAQAAGAARGWSTGGFSTTGNGVFIQFVTNNGQVWG